MVDGPEASPGRNLSDDVEGRRDIARTLFLSLLAVVLVRAFLIEPFKIPSSSMMPTLRIGDHIFVSKFSYGLSIPFTKIEFAAWAEPKRGDVVVFLFPKEETLHYIKRVVGVPGDRLEFKGKSIYVNGEIVKAERVTDPALVAKLIGDAEPSADVYREYLGSAIHFIKHSNRKTYDFSSDTQVEIVPPDKFFVLGDNRDDSYDSRSWGLVPRDHLKGKAQVIWLSLDHDAPWTGVGKIRWPRCGTLIH